MSVEQQRQEASTTPTENSCGQIALQRLVDNIYELDISGRGKETALACDIVDVGISLSFSPATDLLCDDPISMNTNLAAARRG
jgi:hypothetical protein